MSIELLALIVGVVVPLLSAAAIIGGQRVQAKSTDIRLGRLEKSVDQFGERLGHVEGEVLVLSRLDQDRSQSYRLPPPRPGGGPK